MVRNLKRWTVILATYVLVCLFKGGVSVAFEYAFSQVRYSTSQHKKSGIRGLKVSCEHELNRVGCLSKCLILLQLPEVG
jgi:hypothetical protein